MASNKSRAQSEMLQFFRGGKAMREDFVRRCLRDFQEKKKARFQERSASRNSRRVRSLVQLGVLSLGLLQD